MTNDYGAPLDRNGYAPSIVQTQMDRCWKCGRYFPERLARHEVFGAANRAKSKELGLWVHLCHECHLTGKKAVHGPIKNSLALRQAAQKAAMEEYVWSVEKFIREIGKNYLTEDISDAE